MLTPQRGYEADVFSEVPAGVGTVPGCAWVSTPSRVRAWIL